MRENESNRVFLRGALTTLALVLLALTVPAGAAAGWGPDQTISGVGSNVSGSQMAGGSDGSAVVIWTRDIGGFDVIQGARVDIDGTSGPVFDISPLLQNSVDPILVSDSGGKAVVGWTNPDGQFDQLQVTTVGLDGAVGPVRTVATSSTLGRKVSHLSVAYGEDGSIGVAWRRFVRLAFVVQARVIHTGGSMTDPVDVSKMTSSAGPPAIAASKPSEGTPVKYRAAWPQGMGERGNVYTREIGLDGATTDEARQLIWPLEPEPGHASDPTGPGIGGDPHDVRISFDDENIPTIAWVRDRLNPAVLGAPDDSNQRPADDPDDVVFKARMVEGNRNLEGSVTALSPATYGRENDVDDLVMFTPFDGKPILAWRHDLGGGLSRIETGHYMQPGGFQGWTGVSPGGSDVSQPSISGNRKAGIVGWNHSDPSFASWTRFSNENFEPNVLSGYDQVSDPSFIMVDEGYTLAAYTATVQGVSSVRISRYSNPGAGLSPDQFSFGGVNVGATQEVAYLLRSNGQTPVEFNGFDITGPDASNFTLDVPAGCDGTHAIGSACQFRLLFTPSSVGPKSATLTAHTSAGDLQSVVSGSGSTGSRLSLTSTPAKKRVKAGTTVQIKVTARNLTGNEAGDARICPTLNRKVLRLGKKCVSLGSLTANATRQVVFPVRVTAKARRGQAYPVKFRLRATNAVERLSITRLTRK